jgi:hypothetical protein
MAEMVLYVGSVVDGNIGAHGNDAIVPAIAKLRRLALALRASQEEPEEAQIDLVFHVPGPNFSLDYSGLRSGSIWRSKRLIQIQVAVPDQLTAKEVTPFLRSMLTQVPATAEVSFRRRRPPVHWSTAAVTALIGELLDRL